MIPATVAVFGVEGGFGHRPAIARGVAQQLLAEAIDDFSQGKRHGQGGSNVVAGAAGDERK